MMSAKMHGSEVTNAFVRLAHEKQYTVGKAMRMSARRIAANLTYETEPRGFDEAARKSGENAIKGDIKKVYATASMVFGELLKENRGLADAFYAAFKNGELEKARQYLQSSISDWRSKPIGLLNPVLHQYAHNVPGGRVAKNQTPQLIVAAENLVSFIEYMQSRSGLCASAWAACATKLGGTREIPKWKKGRHGVTKKKFNVVDKSEEDNASITMENLVPYVDRACDDRKMQRVVDREEETLKDLLDRALDAALKKSGFHY